MCKQDVNIGRRLESITQAVPPGQAPSSLTMKARPGRIGVALVVYWNPAPGATDFISVGPLLNNAVTPIAVVNAYNQSCYLSVKDYGQDLTGPLGLDYSIAGQATVYFTEYFAPDDLAGI